MGPEVSEKGADRRSGSSCARPNTTDCHRTRNNNIIRKSCLRPHSRLDRISTPYRREYDRAMVEGDQFANTPSGVSAFTEKVLGEASVGKGISCGNDGNPYG